VRTAPLPARRGPGRIGPWLGFLRRKAASRTRFRPSRCKTLAVAAVTSLMAVGVSTSTSPAQAAPVPSLHAPISVPEPAADGHVQRDQLQILLEADLQSFLTQDYDKMVDEGCVGALTQYFNAAHYDDLLERVYDNLADIGAGMTQGDFVTAGLISTRIGQAAADLYLFAAGAPTAITSLGKVLENVKNLVRANSGSAEDLKNVKAAIDLAIADAKDISQYKSFSISYQPSKGVTGSDRFSAALNLLGSIKALLAFFKPGGLLGNVEKVLSSAEVGALRRFLSAGKTLWDVISDIKQWQKDHKSLDDAFQAAWFLYTTLLQTLQGAVKDMRSAVDACKPAPQTGPGQIPSGGLTQSRCGAMGGPHWVEVGKEITFSAGPPIPEACHGAAGWTWPGMGDTVQMTGLTLKRPCAANSGSCTYVGAYATGTFQVGCINGNSGFGPWVSCDYYVVVPAGTGVIEGYVKDLDGSPVAGIAVVAHGTGGTHASGLGVSTASGYFLIPVLEGTYALEPIGTGNIVPDAVTVGVPRDGTGRADFTQQTGTDLQLSLDKTSVAADGFSVLNGTLTTKTYGLYGSDVPIIAGNAQVQLSAMPGDAPTSAVTTGPLATICQTGGSRLWPGGNIAAPVASPVDVTTGPDGQYSFSVTVGTKPGTWKLNAWALNADDVPAVDKDHAAKTVSVEFTPISSGALSSMRFVNALRETIDAGGSIGGQLANQGSAPNDIAALLGQAAASKGPDRGLLGGLAFAAITGKDGGAFLIYPTDDPPPIDEKTGAVLFSAKDANDLVWSPNEWDTDNKVPAPNNSLSSAVTSHSYPLAVPTFEQWRQGDKVSGWVPVKGNVASISTGLFQWFGWAYPGITTAGACY
jgi:hypothetical protein